MPVTFQDDDHAELNKVVGQLHHLLGEDGDEHAQRLVLDAVLLVRQDGGYFHPDPFDNWNQASYEAVLSVAPGLVAEFTPEVHDRIWAKLQTVLLARNRNDVLGVVVEAQVPPLPEVGDDWRARAAESALAVVPTNQGRRERASGGYPERDGLVLGSGAEAVVFDLLVELQRERPSHETISIAPVPGVQMRDQSPRTPDFIVLGNGRAVVIEVDDPSHYGKTRKADDADRDRHWARCGVPTVRFPSQHTDEPEALRNLLREELFRHLWRRS